MRINLAGRRALVTGSTSGMGYAIAAGLAEAGAAVILHGRSADRLAAEVPGADVSGHAAELADADALATLIEACPTVDILVSNTGPTHSKPFLTMNGDQWQRYCDAYISSASTLARAYMPAMMSQGLGPCHPRLGNHVQLLAR